ncbi:ATP-binding protein [Streptomyces sp. NRRL S-920]|uniref:ATP-binding protein n=1 Tax=Streptomyces sp. NRRL S-920 TaxID=1463921 RepID=UPI00131B920E|nr:ATP-binding protein [Streptomyces sp. NRRL S-920]
MGTSVQARDISGQLVVGDHNDVNVVNHIVVFDHGSSVAPSAEGPPRVRRRPRPADWVRPPRAPVLLGRDEELARVNNRLAEGYAVRLHGPPGSGRTALLSRVAADREPDAPVIFIQAGGSDTEDILQQIFQACYDTEDYKPGSARLKRLMAPIEALVVIDDFTDPASDGLAVLRDTLPGCDVLVASTEQGPTETGSATRACQLGGLSASASLALLERELGRPLSDAESREAARFAAEVHGHPRALVASAALLEAGGSTAEAFTADETAVASGLAGRLGQGAADLLGALCAFQPLSIPTALLGAVGAGTPVAGACAELQQLRLVTHESGGYRARGRLAVLTAERAGTLRSAADATPDLATWIGQRPARREVAAGSGLIRRALREAARQGDDTAVRDLARAAAPVLARSLCWGAWKEVLALGGAAAVRLDATEDVTYFAREEDVRRKALGLVSAAASVASAAVGVAVGQGTGGTDRSSAEGAQQDGTGSFAGSGGGLSGPLATGIGVLVLGAGGLLAGLLMSGGGSTPAARPATTPPSAPGATAASERPGTFEPSRPGAGRPSGKPPPRREDERRDDPRPPGNDRPDEPSRPAPSKPESRRPPSCLLVGVSSTNFQPLPVGSEDSRTLLYDGYDCDTDESVTFSVTPETEPASFTLEHRGCSPTGDRQFRCTMIVTFRPQAPGSYTAKLDVTHDGDSIGMDIHAYTQESPSETTLNPTA